MTALAPYNDTVLGGKHKGFVHPISNTSFSHPTFFNTSGFNMVV